MVLIAAVAALSYGLAFRRRRANCAEATVPVLLVPSWPYGSAPAVSAGTDLVPT